MLTIALFALAAAAQPSAHQREVERAIFDLCPRAMAGTFSLEDEAQVAAAGYRIAPPRQTEAGAIPRIHAGSGTERIELSSSTTLCGVWFGGADNAALLRAVRRHARSAGYRGRGPLRLGDGTPIQLLSGPEGRSLTIIEGNAGGGLDFDPVTTVITMTGSD